MIHTITLNPSIDLTIRLDAIKLGEVQPLGDPLEDAGGKGMNVARALQALEVPVTAWVFLGGDRGRRWLDVARHHQAGIETIELGIETRQNIKVFEELHHRQTDFNFPGPQFEPSVGEEFFLRLRLRLRAGDIVVLAGSPLRGTPYAWWMELAEIVRSASARLVVDMAGPGLLQIAKADPWLIKINREEFNEWYGLAAVSLNEVFVSLQNRESILSHLVVTDGASGALLWTNKRQFYKLPALKVKVAGTVGAGDAFLAGWLYGWSQTEGDWENAVRWGSAASAGAVEQPGTRFAPLARVQELVGMVGM